MVKRYLVWIFILSFLTLACSNSPGYHVGSSSVTYVTRDAAGYTRSRTVEGADPSTFSVIREPFGKDKSKVFYHGDELKGASPDTFKVIDDDYYSTDGKLVFAGRSLVSRDPEGFVILKKGYSKDSQRVFYLGSEVPGAEAPSLEILEGHGAYARDAKGAYREGKLITGADGATFEPLNYYYSRDQEQVFHKETPLEGADPETFITEPKRQLAKDKTQAWYLDFKLEKLDGSKTEFLEGLYIKDEEDVYFGNKWIEGADAPTFETYTENGAVYGRDKIGTYSAGRRR